MHKIVKITLWTVAGVGLASVAAVGVFVATFNPNDYKPQIIAAVKDSKQRTLTLDGDLKLQLYPSLGLSVEQAALSEHQSDQVFAKLGKLTLSVELMPLLQKHLVVDGVQITGLDATIVRDKQGQLNIQDLLSKDESKPSEIQFDVDQVVLNDSRLGFHDLASGARWELAEINVSTGHLAEAANSSVKGKWRLLGTQPQTDLEMDVDTRFFLDLKAQHYKISSLDLGVKGRAAQVSELDLKLSGKADLDLGKATYQLDGFKLSGQAAAQGSRFKLALDVPTLEATPEKIRSDALSADFDVSGAQQAKGTLKVTGLQGDASQFSAQQVRLQAQWQQGSRTLNGTLQSKLQGARKAGRADLTGLSMQGDFKDPNLPVNPLIFALNGSGSVGKTLALNVSGKVDQSTVQAKLSVAPAAPPAIEFDVAMDRLDLNRWTAQNAQPANPAKPIDLSGLEALNANGHLRIQDLRYGKFQASNVQMKVQSKRGQLQASPISANLYQGSLNGSLSLTARPLQVSTTQRLSNINVAQLMAAFNDNNRLEGRGNVQATLNTSGTSVDAMTRNLNGSASAHLTDGSIRGINLAAMLRNAKDNIGKLQGKQTGSANTQEKTDFSELSASFAIAQGVATNNDLMMKSPLLRVTGNGNASLVTRSMDYLVKANLVNTSTGQGGKELNNLRSFTVPVRVTGPFTAPAYAIDFSAMFEALAQQKLDEEKAKLKTSLEDKLKESLGRKTSPQSSTAPAGSTQPTATPSDKDKLKDKLKGLFK